MKGLRFGIAFRLLAGLAGLVLLTAGAGGIALVALNTYQRALDEMARQHLPALASSAALVQQTQKLVATAPALIVAESQYERRGLMLRISGQKASIDEQLEALRRFGLGEDESATISRIQADLVENLNDLDAAVEHKIDQDRRIQDLAQELRQLRERIHGLAANPPNASDAARLTEDAIALHDWRDRSEEILALLLTAFDAQNRGALDSIRVQLLDAIDRISALTPHLPAAERSNAAGIVAELSTLGLDTAGLLETRGLQLDTARTEQSALARNRLLADLLVNAVSGPQQRITSAALALGAEASERTRQTAQNLIVLVIAGVIGAGLILYYILKHVIRRLRRLQASMQGRQAGLDTPIDTHGHDEIAEMAQALDFCVRTISEREAEKERALVDLKAAQASLVHAEKLASLGQLTAGIAHEIKNPLNFVNNFASLSLELCEELQAALNANDVGARDEAVNLAYHGSRAQDPNFRVTVERHFQPLLGTAELVPQDITRVLLNLLANAFYAALQRLATAAPGFAPVVTVTTIGDAEQVELRITDNGAGMSPEVQAKLFTPFFTTKPTGEGTGLGLSLSYDIVHHQHRGRIEVESVPDSHTTVRVTLPRRRRADPPRRVAALSAE